ncbi:MAG: hypothetical protein ABIK83_14520 [Candidatus Zixiibacteriota bacterium]
MKRMILALATVLLLAVNSGQISTAYSATQAKSNRLVNRVFDGSENISAQYSPSFGPSMAPGQIMGMTIYDYQHNGTMGRQVSYWPGTSYVHFTWMKRPAVGGDRKINYNAYDLGTSSFEWGTGMTGGKPISDVNGGYTTIDVTSGGLAVVAFHFGPAVESYSPVADIDAAAGVGLFTFEPGAPGPPGTLTCEGWITGGWEWESNYLWPVVDWQDSSGKSIMHAVGCESPPQSAPAGEIQTIVYWRNSGGTSLDWPDCGMAVDSVYNITPVVRSDKLNGSGKVAIVWMKPVYYDGELNDPCGFTQWQNDVVCMESHDYGSTWGQLYNITDYASLGPINEQPNGQAYTDLSAMYGSDGKFHVVWATALRDVNGTNPCSPENQSRIWHWDDGPGGCISIVYDGSRPSSGLDPGAWNLSACKMNISECIDGGTSRMYVSFTRFGAYASANGDTNLDNSATGYSNGDIFVSASIDGGVTYGEAVNLTNSPSPDCAAGDCESDHWSSMSMYTDNATGLHIQYINDKDAGGLPKEEGTATDNPILYLNHPCFTPATYCAVGYTPTMVGYPLAIAPIGGWDCTIDPYTTFSINLANIGSEYTSYVVTSNASWLTPASASNYLPAGCGNSESVEFTLGPIANEGVYHTTLDVSACSGAFQTEIVIELIVACDFYVPESVLLNTSCWSVGVWNVPRAGLGDRDDQGNMWYYLEGVPFMSDNGLIITMANDTTKTSFSMYDGSDSRVEFRAQGPLTTASIDYYDYAHGNWSVQDTSIVGEIEFWAPIHPDTCVLIERTKVCNNEEFPITIHIGEGIDWDIPDNAGNVDNQSMQNYERQEVYQFGAPYTESENWFATASFCSEIAGATILENDEWVYPNSGYDPAEIGGLSARLYGFYDSDSVKDLSSFYAVAQNLTLDPGECYTFCKVKASSLTGLNDLQHEIDKGKEWIAANGLDCPGCEPGPQCMPGDADQSGGVDIDDIVYLFAYICFGGPMPPPCGDVDGNCVIDGFDIVYLIHNIFTGGPAPIPPPCNDPPMQQDAGMPDVVEMAPNDAFVNIGESFSIPIIVDNDEGLSLISFNTILAEYISGAEVLSCDSVTFWGTRLDGGSPLPQRSFSVSGFESAAGGYISLSMGTTWPPADTLDHGWGSVADVWFTAHSEGEVLLQCTLDSPILYWTIINPNDYACFTPLINFGRIFVSGDDDVDPFESSTDPAFVPTPAGSHPFVVTLRNFMGDPIEGSIDVSVQIINYGKALVLCPTQAEFPVLSPVSPSDSYGRAMFFLAAGNCVPGCEAVISCSAGEIGRVPVRPVDANGDLLVHPFDDMTDDPDCSDFNNNGVIDADDQNILHLYDWQSCGDPCSAYRLSIAYSPEDSLVVGSVLDYIQATFQNTTSDACYLQSVTFYTTCFGYGNPEEQIGSYNLNLWVSPGASYSQGIVNFTIPPCGLGCIIAEFDVLDCSEPARVETCPQRYFECAPEAGTCYDFETNLLNEAWVFLDPPRDTADGFAIPVSPAAGYHAAGNILLLRICHTTVAVIQDSVIFRYYLSSDGVLSPDDDLYENVVSVRANNGDVTGDCFVDIDDPVFIIAYIFSGGPAPNPIQIGNVDCSMPEPVDIDDVVYLINYIFAGGPPPEFCPELW